MEVLVCIKRVILAGNTFTLNEDHTDIDTRHLGYTLSPHEESAVEAAVRLNEEFGGTTTLLTLGHVDSEEQIRSQMAIGPDRAIVLETDGSEWDPQATANAIIEAIKKEATKFDLIIFGSESADTAGYQTGIRVAHALDLPIVTNVKGLKVENGVARCERAVGTMREIYEVPLPAVLTVRDGIAIPRYPSVPGRIKARKKPMDVFPVERPAAKIEKVQLELPPVKAKGATMLSADADGAQKLVEIFREIGVLA